MPGPRRLPAGLHLRNKGRLIAGATTMMSGSALPSVEEAKGALPLFGLPHALLQQGLLPREGLQRKCAEATPVLRPPLRWLSMSVAEHIAAESPTPAAA